MNESIKDIKIGDEAEIVGFLPSDQQYRKRLLTMGLTRGTKIKVTKVAPMGDPVEVEVRGYKLSLRKYEAEILKLRRV